MQGRRAQGSPVRGFISTLKAPTLLAGLVLALGTEIHASTATAVGAAVPGSPRSGPRQETVVPNDNRHPGGTLAGDTLTLRTSRPGKLATRRTRRAGAHHRSVRETSSALTVPAPLIRVEEGMRIVVSIRNDLDAVLRVHGLWYTTARRARRWTCRL